MRTPGEIFDALPNGALTETLRGKNLFPHSAWDDRGPSWDRRPKVQNPQQSRGPKWAQPGHFAAASATAVHHPSRPLETSGFGREGPRLARNPGDPKAPPIVAAGGKRAEPRLALRESLLQWRCGKFDRGRTRVEIAISI